MTVTYVTHGSFGDPYGPHKSNIIVETDYDEAKDFVTKISMRPSECFWIVPGTVSLED